MSCRDSSTSISSRSIQSLSFIKINLFFSLFISCKFVHMSRLKLKFSYNQPGFSIQAVVLLFMRSHEAWFANRLRFPKRLIVKNYQSAVLNYNIYITPCVRHFLLKKKMSTRPVDDRCPANGSSSARGHKILFVG